MDNGPLAVHASYGRLGDFNSEFKFNGKIRTLLLASEEEEVHHAGRSFCGKIQMTLPPTPREVFPRISRIREEIEVTILFDSAEGDYSEKFDLVDWLSNCMPVVVVTRSKSPALGARFFYQGACCVIDGNHDQCGAILERSVNTYGIYQLLCPSLNHRMNSNLVIRSLSCLFTHRPQTVMEWAKRLRVTSRGLLKYWQIYSGVSAKDALFLFRVIQSFLASKEFGDYLHDPSAFPDIYDWRVNIHVSDRERLACFPNCLNDLLKNIRAMCPVHTGRQN